MIEYTGNRKDAEDIAACVGNILATPYGTMPYMRSMGIETDVLSLKNSELEGEYYAQAVDQVEEWEERASIGEIIFCRGEGIIPKVVLEDGE